MALALYRKYRPRTFAEIIGQEHVTEPLSQALRSDRLHHAYLFSGPRGCGKTSSARILARSLNCEKGPTPDPCGECDSCRALAPDGAGSIDVIEIDAASHGGVDDARDLRERAFFAPVSSRFKIYVIDEAHMVSSAGFNALLKLVEEPPEYVKFVFATTEPEKVLGTIKSRTHHYPFRLIPPAVLRPYLEQLCVAEGASVEAPVFPLVVRAGGGSARDSLSVLDQLIAGAGPEGVTYARAVSLLGVTDVALIDEVCEAFAAGDGRAVFTTIDRVADAGHDARRFAGDLLERLRDLIVLQQVPDAVEKGLLNGSEDELARMATQAQQFGPAALSRMADIVHTGLTDMRGATAPRLVLELIAARMLLPGADDSTASLLARVERMERRLTLGGEVSAAAAPIASAPAPMTAAAAPAMPTAHAPSDLGNPPAVPAAPAAPAPTASPAPALSPPRGPDAPAAASPSRARSAAGPVDAVVLRDAWGEVMATIRGKSRKFAAVVQDGVVRDVDGDVIVLTFKHPFHAKAVADEPGLLTDALYEVLGGRWRIRSEVTGQAGRSGESTFPASRPQPPSGASGSAPQRPNPAPSRESGSSPQRSGRAPASEDGLAGSPRIAPSGDGPADDTVASRPRGGVATAASAVPEPEPDDGWPTPAQLGGSGADGGSPATPESGVPTGPPPEDDWPEPAPLGGSGADGGTPATGSEPGSAKTSPADRPRTPAGAVQAAPTGASGVPADPMVYAARTSAGVPAGATAQPSGSLSHPEPAAGAVLAEAVHSSSSASTAHAASLGSPSTAQTRASAGRRAARVAAGRAGSTRSTSREDVWAGSGEDEPPYDPEFEPPVTGVAGPSGDDFDEEPVDDSVDLATSSTIEQHALDLLRETLGAETIADR